jgi:hypothetical protein
METFFEPLRWRAMENRLAIILFVCAASGLGATIGYFFYRDFRRRKAIMATGALLFGIAAFVFSLLATE